MKQVPSVIRRGVIDMQVCVPAHWNNQAVKEFADFMNPCGTEMGWQIRKDTELLAGDPERNPCQAYSGFVHVTLDA